MSTNAFTLAQGVPARVTAGDLWSWRIDALADTYPSPDYALLYAIKPRSTDAPTTALATSDADGWLVAIAAVTTANLAAGTYDWTLFATRASDGARQSIDCGVIEVAPNPTATGDTRSAARRHLDAINAVIEGRITKDVESYSIEGRALTRTPLADLHRLRARYLAEVQAEDAVAAGRRPGPRYRKLGFRNG